MSTMATSGNALPLRAHSHVFTGSRFSTSSLCASDSDLSGKPYADDQPRRSGDHRPHPRKSQPRRKFIDPECAVEDITPDHDQDQGYDADVDGDGELPTETEEPDSESEPERSASDCSNKLLQQQQQQQRQVEAAEGKPQTPGSLIKDFRNLRCDPPQSGNSANTPENGHLRHAHQGSQGNASLKRSHSEDSLTDTDEDPSPAAENHAVESHRLRRRVNGPEAPPHTLPYDAGGQMDIDDQDDREMSRGSPR